ncbi:hypothetical protein Anas_02427 [Armadillidium nasatum]|uniref:Uncharacterized protein n=1 Tax=Armadillidium nasatum TaxID=96803 RepID=A0A5N5T1D2_9CRUS|nr:hypothetical protein Anas_02427 [Armadillidium nasatum]
MISLRLLSNLNYNSYFFLSLTTKLTSFKHCRFNLIKLHGKLFIIMGLPWAIEAFTSFASDETECYIW